MTSTSFILCTGEKKWSPTKFFCLASDTFAERTVIEMLEVFEAMMQLDFKMLSSFLNTSPFTAASSKTASMTM